MAEGIDVSVDTWKREVAAAALDAGAVMINDVSGLGDLEIARQCASHGAALAIMHTRARPKYKDFPHDSREDAVRDVRAFLEEKIDLAVSLGVSKSSIVVDPGPDFGKTPAQTVAVLRHLGDLHSLGCPILLAVSRKGFIGALTETRPRDRLPGTLAAIAAGVALGAGILRVHDVAAVRQYLRVADVLAGRSEIPDDLRNRPENSREPRPESAVFPPA
jgi:dihydropteroate synthase